MKNRISRRKFLKGTIGAGAVVAAAGFGLPDYPEKKDVRSLEEDMYDPKGLPTTRLGKTGVRIPRMAIGLGSRFLTIKSPDEALEMCNYALDNGLYFWDTAHDYVNIETGAISEVRLGNIVRLRRKEIFLSTKISARDPEKFKIEIEESLKRLQTDHLDIVKLHAVSSEEDVKIISRKGGVLDILEDLKRQKVTRFIGFSGHENAAALKSLSETGRFDTMLFAMNHYDNRDDRQGTVIPAGKKNGMGVMLMKTVRPVETVEGFDPEGLIRFALSLDGPDGIVVGMDSKKIVMSNITLLKNFKPLGAEEKVKIMSGLSPFFRHNRLEWMKAGYHDGKA